MHITRMRLVGFKSFVEPTELIIEPGLTGVVGPNGCGKSNLLEALRWVMGETSYKSMRGDAMEDVIFSGTSGRPARVAAEVTLTIDNAARKAPAEYNDGDEIEIARRIERDSGSSYRINHREARARDIRVLFEDAATGARSPALVRQGQIGQIVNAKPDQRRRILEDAAGIAGLHSRRHEAELRLRAAEANLARISDVLGQLRAQADQLARQARQARRYAALSDDIRRLEATRLYLTWHRAQADVDRCEAMRGEVLEQLAAATTAEAAAVSAEAEAAAAIQPLRDSEAVAAATFTRLRNEHTSLEREIERARSRAAELDALIEQCTRDLARETSLVNEAGELERRLNASLAELAGTEDDGTRERELNERLAEAQADCTSREQALLSAETALSRARADRSAAEARAREIHAQSDRLGTRLAAVVDQIAKAQSAAPDPEQHALLKSRIAEHATALAAAATSLEHAELSLADAERASQATAADRGAAALALRQVETERRTIADLLERPDRGDNAILDQITVAAGYETALGAALGDDLEASMSPDAPIRWSIVDDAGDDPKLPEAAEPLSRFVTAPPHLDRRLRQIGVISRDDGPTLQSKLQPGQRLVTRDGALWRWDGFVAGADAPTATAQRLSLRNRLAALEAGEVEARGKLETALAADNAAQREAEAARIVVLEMRKSVETCRTVHATAEMEAAAFTQAAREADARLATLTETRAGLEAEIEAANESIATLAAESEALPDLAALDADAASAREATTTARERVAEARAELTAFQREQRHREAQRAALEADIARWTERARLGREQIASLDERHQQASRERSELEHVPAEIEAHQRALLGEIARAETARGEAADAVAEAESRLKSCADTLKSAREAVAQRREDKARIEAQLESTRDRRRDAARHIQDALGVAPDGCLEVAGLVRAADLPDLGATEAHLARLKSDRDRLGAVNLAANAELETLQAQFDEMDRERADVEAAVQKLRSGIAGLTRQGRARLRQAFDDVDRHFRNLFETLFGGGEARLELIEDSDDPLAGGLEIIARPPGKKPATLSLLSGGEQALTALALIFAVFLTNPSPICVLDEVDAPLDDANVDRFCTLLEKMSADTETRFLVITHHPMTMSRMDRLFGVTMVEKGISQLVSVDLSTAEAFAEAG